MPSFRLYRKMFFVIALSVVLILVIGALFYCEWGSYGIAADGAKADFAGSSYRGEKPVIHALERRVLQNEKVALKELAEAQDENGESLAGYLRFYDSEGAELTGLLDTSVPGKYEITVSVKSPVTGRSVRKAVRVLVDGKAEKGVEGG